MTSISLPAFAATYDGAGMRASKTESETTTYFLYDGDDPIVEETWNSGTSTATFSNINVYGVDGCRARFYPTLSTPAFYAFSYDPSGNLSTTQSSINTANPVYTISNYEAYGHRTSHILAGTGGPSSHDDPSGFGGQYGYYTDNTGLLLLGHRYYDPGTGRFLNRDSIGYNGGVNLYGYADGNPVNRVDPDGTDWTFLGMQFGSDGPTEFPAPTQAEIDARPLSRPRPPHADGDLTAGELSGSGPMHQNQGHAVHNLGSGMGQTFENAAVMIPIPGGVTEEEAAAAVKAMEFSVKPSQIHHFATDKSLKYTGHFKAIAQKYGLKLDDTWNTELLPHQGRHPNAYHEWVLTNMKQADKEAAGDKEKFLKLYNEYVKEPVRSTPARLYAPFYKKP